MTAPAIHDTPRDDERRGLPSASALHRIAECPGSLRLSRQCAEPPATAEAAEGSMLHERMAWLVARDFDIRIAPPNHPVLDEEQAGAVESAIKMFRALCEAFLGGDNCEAFLGFLGRDAPPLVCKLEDRFWLSAGNAEPVFSAKPDLVVWAGRKTLVIDWKFGRLPVARPAANHQLMGIAACLAGQMGPDDTMLLDIIQPRVPHQDKPPPVYYGKEEADAAAGAVLGILAEARDPDAALRTGEWCRYCPAMAGTDKRTGEAGLCPAARDAVVVMADEAPPFVVSGGLLDRCQVAKKIISSIEKQARLLLARDPDAIAGWELAPGRTTKRVTDVLAGYERLQEFLTPAEFGAACSVSLPRLAKSLKGKDDRASTELAARRMAERLLEGILTQAQGTPALAKTKDIK